MKEQSLRETFSALMDQFAAGAAGQQVDLPDVFKKSLDFFELLKDRIKSGSGEQKTEALQIMTEMYQKMQEETKKICEKTNMTQEELNAFAADPKNFTPEQFQTVQEAREKLAEAGKELAEVTQNLGGGKAETVLSSDMVGKRLLNTGEQKKAAPANTLKTPPQSQWQKT